MFPCLVRCSDFKLIRFFVVKVCFVPLQLACWPLQTLFHLAFVLVCRDKSFWHASNQIPQTMEATHGIFDGQNCLFLLVIFCYGWSIPMNITILHHHLGRRCFFPPTQLPPKSKFCSGYRCWLPPSGMSIRLQIWICLVATSDAWQKTNRGLEEPQTLKKKGLGDDSLNRGKMCFMRKKLVRWKCPPTLFSKKRVSFVGFIGKGDDVTSFFHSFFVEKLRSSQLPNRPLGN